MSKNCSPIKWQKFYCYILFYVSLTIGCQQSNPPKHTIQKGEAFAKIRCASCHQYPEPTLLDKPTWEKYVLPRMGHFLGIYTEASPRKNLIENNFGGQLVERAKIFPTTPIIPLDEWEAIQAFYLDNAPDTLAIPAKIISDASPLFKVKKPAYKLSPPATTFVGFSPFKNILIGDANKNSLFIFDKNLQLQKAAKLEEGIVQVQETIGSYLITTMGSFSPTDAPTGKIYSLPKNGKPLVLVDSLQRPVSSTFTDLNNDGYVDIVLAEFGKWTGGLYWFKNYKNRGFEKQLIKKQAGATSIEIVDLNKDSLPDIVALFGQGKEEIVLFEKQNEDTFKEIPLLSFPASYGSSHFSFFDVNADGLKDIIYTAGDNADYPAIAKPYHGIRIFQNEGNYQFKEIWFYHLNGAYKAIPQDFDKDGDMDIAAISFFPDFTNSPQEGFIYLENIGDFKFKAHSIPAFQDGRWLVMDAADLEGDGDIDILLGSLTMESVLQPKLVHHWVEQGIPFLLLENTLR